MKLNYSMYNVRRGVQKVKTRTALLFSALVLSLASGGGMTLAVFGTSHADTTTTSMKVTPASPGYDANNVVGVQADYAPGFPGGSVASDGSGKTDWYVTPDQLFGHDVALGDIASMSYWTKKGETHVASVGDWSLIIYTNPYAGDTHGGSSWYGDRIGTEPYFAKNISDPANTWNNWTTGGTANQMRFYESTNGYFGSYTDPVWGDFVAGNALSGDPYAGHTVKFFSLQTGSAWANGFTGQLDGLTVELTDGAVATVNFEPTCTDVNTSKGVLSVAKVGGEVTGEVDATGCDVGVYYNSDNPGNVSGAEIHDANLYGVFVDGNVADISTNVSDSTVYNIGNHTSGNFEPNGNQGGAGIYYAASNSPGNVSGEVSGNDVNEYQKGGIVVSGDNAHVSVRGNVVTGLSPVTFIAQNGIQFGYGATGQIMDNTVNGNSYEGEDWTSTGILVFETSNVVVQRNTVENNQTGIAIEAWCWYVDAATNNKVVNNEVSGAQYGISVAAYSLGGYSTCDAEANNNKVTNNKVNSTDGDTGIFVGTGAYWDGTDNPVAHNNKVVSNKVKGFATVIETSSSSTPKVHANVEEL